MSYFKKSNIGFILLVAILLATNIATIGTIFYNQNKTEERVEIDTETEFPNRSKQRQRRFGNYMSERLKLTDEQQREFASLRDEFHTKAEAVSIKINEKRKLLYVELAKEGSDLEQLNKIADEIGLLHAELKKLSVNHYISMKKICSPTQQDELYKMFRAMFEKESRGGKEIHKRKYRNKKK